MATITATLDTGAPRGVDFHRGVISGTFTTNATAPTADQIVLLPTSCFITSFTAVNQTGIGSIHAQRNINSAGSAANGTVYVRGSDPAANTYHFTATFVGS